jgi:hypothetical protein
MLSSLLGTAFAMGLLGSVHCAAMCGPIAVAACGRGTRTRLGEAVGYLSARLLGHIIAGFSFGLVGRTIMGPEWNAARASLVFGAAAVMIWQGWRSLLLRRQDEGLVELGRGQRSLSATFFALLPKHGAVLGALTAILPCGQLAGAWMLAASTGGPAQGAATMAVFSLASAPGLLAAIGASLTVDRLGDRLVGRNSERSTLGFSRRWRGALWCAVALLMATRTAMQLFGGGSTCHG